MNVASLGFRTDLMLLHMGGSFVVDNGSHLVVRTPANPGFWWGNFLLLDAPLREGDAGRWTKVFAAEFPGAEHLALGVDGTDGDTGDASGLARLGVTTEVNAVLTATRMRSPDRARPGVDVRPLAGDDDWVQAADLRSTCEGADPSDADHRQFVERHQAGYRRLCEAGYGAWFGAFVDGRMRAGAGLFSDGGGAARFQNVHTHPGFRRQGLALSLFSHAGHWGLTELRARTLVIVADPDYHAIELYRRLGFAETERKVQLHRGPATDRD